MYVVDGRPPRIDTSPCAQKSGFRAVGDRDRWPMPCPTTGVNSDVNPGSAAAVDWPATTLAMPTTIDKMHAAVPLPIVPTPG